MKKMKTIVVGLVAAGLLTGCIKEPENDVDQSQYYTSYFLFYDEGLDLTQSIAIFTGNDPNGFRQELIGSANVTFRNTSLTLDPQLVEYRTNISEYVPIGEFKYTDQVGREYINEIEQNIIGFPADFDSVSRFEDLEFFWKGEPLEENETIILEIFDTDFQVSQKFGADEVGSTMILVPDIGLATFDSGPVIFALRRQKTLDVGPNPGVGGEIHAIYLKSQEIILTDE